MADGSKIEWTEATWNPVRGCSRVSPGCEHCYAEHTARRYAGPGLPYEGLLQIERVCKCGHPEQHHKRVVALRGTCQRCTCAVFVAAGDRPRAKWNGTVKLVPGHLFDPIRWRKGRRIFVNSMSDLFHEALPFETIAAIFGVMAAAPQHTFQVLTKRAERMREFFDWLGGTSGAGLQMGNLVHAARDLMNAEILRGNLTRERGIERALQVAIDTWYERPLGTMLDNVILCVSIEDQQRCDERLEHLIATPAVWRGVSYEPALGPVDFGFLGIMPSTISQRYAPVYERIHWIIVGGESDQPGQPARAFDPEWAESVIDQCRDAGVACFVKQLGSNPVGLHLEDRKGGNIDEWPEELRVREYPEIVT